MSKFERIVEGDVSGSVEQAFGFKQASVSDDPFEHLKKAADTRQSFIRRESVGDNIKTIKRVERDWNQSNQPAKYAQTNFFPEEDMSNIDPYETSVHGIRRSDYEEDEGDNVRDIKLASTGDYASMYLQPASMWGTDEDELSDTLKSMMGESVIMQTREARLAESSKNKNQDWEDNKMKEISGRKVVNCRANPLLKTENVSVTDSRFGLIDHQSIKNREEQRVASATRKMAIKNAITRQDMTTEEKHKVWEESVQVGQSSVQEHESNWLEEYITQNV